MRGVQPILARQADLAAVWLFGSVIRGALRFDSDVDFAFLFRLGVASPQLRLASIGAQLETATAPFPVDAVDLGTQGVIFAHRVLCEGRLIHETDRERRIDFTWKTCVRAFDFQPTHDLAIRSQREGILRRLTRRGAQ